MYPELLKKKKKKCISSERLSFMSGGRQLPVILT